MQLTVQKVRLFLCAKKPTAPHYQHQWHHHHDQELLATIDFLFRIRLDHVAGTWSPPFSVPELGKHTLQLQKVHRIAIVPVRWLPLLGGGPPPHPHATLHVFVSRRTTHRIHVQRPDSCFPVVRQVRHKSVFLVSFCSRIHIRR